MNKIMSITRFAIVLTVFTAIIAQVIYSTLNIPGYNPVNFFSFFTVQSSIFSAVVLLIATYISLKSKPSRTLEYFRGAATLYMIVVGVVYFFLLRNSGSTPDSLLPRITFILHYLFPVYLLIDWVISPLRHKLRFNKSLTWLLFPIAYLVYSMIRGAITGWYPYAFLDPSGPDGVTGIVIVGIAIALLCLGLTWLITRKKGLKNS